MLEYLYTFMAYILLRKSQWDKELIRAIQETKFKRLIKAAKNTKFYPELWKKNGIKLKSINTLDDLKKMPIIDRKIVQKNYGKILNKKEYFTKKFSTSGTTSRPLEIPANLTDIVYRNANYLRILTEHGINLYDGKIAYYWYKREKKRFRNLLSLNKYILLPSWKDSVHVSLMNRIKPDIVFYFPWRLYHILLKFEVSFKPNLILTQGEILPESIKNFIEKKLGAKVIDIYATQEFGLVAWQCEKDRYHINEESVVVEQVGNELVLTNLNNYAFPLIRYLIGDKGKVKSPKCRCGRRLKTLEIYGRSKYHEKIKSYWMGSFKDFINRLAERVEGFSGIKMNENKIVVYTSSNKRNENKQTYFENEYIKLQGKKPKFSKSGKLNIFV